jgi:hypothetical protein
VRLGFGLVTQPKIKQLPGGLACGAYVSDSGVTLQLSATVCGVELVLPLKASGQVSWPTACVGAVLPVGLLTALLVATRRRQRRRARQKRREGATVAGRAVLDGLQVAWNEQAGMTQAFDAARKAARKEGGLVVLDAVFYNERDGTWDPHPSTAVRRFCIPSLFVARLTPSFRCLCHM